MSRTHMNPQEREAMDILDLWRAGAGKSDGITPALIAHCLRVTGDAIGQQ